MQAAPVGRSVAVFLDDGRSCTIASPGQLSVNPSAVRLPRTSLRHLTRLTLRLGLHVSRGLNLVLDGTSPVYSQKG